MGMSSTPANVGSMLNSGLTQQGNQQGPGSMPVNNTYSYNMDGQTWYSGAPTFNGQQGTNLGQLPGPGNPSIGMPYGPGYTDPNQQQKGPGDVSIGMPAGPGYMQPSSGGKGGMPSTPTQGPEPTFNFSPGFGMGGIEQSQFNGYNQGQYTPNVFGNTLPNPGTPEFDRLFWGPAGIAGQPSIDMPAGPGGTPTPSTMENPATGRPYDIRDFPGYPGSTPVAGGNLADPMRQVFDNMMTQPGGNLGNPQIGMPAGPGYMQPTPLPTPKAVAQPTPLPSPKPAPAPINMQGRIGMPAGPGFMQPKPAPVVKPVPKPAPVPQTMEQIRSQVGIRSNPVKPTKVQQPMQPARPMGRIGRR